MKKSLLWESDSIISVPSRNLLCGLSWRGLMQVQINFTTNEAMRRILVRMIKIPYFENIKFWSCSFIPHVELLTLSKIVSWKELSKYFAQNLPSNHVHIFYTFCVLYILRYIAMFFFFRICSGICSKQNPHIVVVVWDGCYV